MLAQPFVWSSTEQRWSKLTHANYPLDLAIGSGTDGDNWTSATVQENPDVTGLIIDATDFVITHANAGVAMGHGIITATGTVEVNGRNLDIEHRYQLSADDPVIRVTTQLTNLSGSPVDNVHLWVGTRDDYIGTTDYPTKTKGNLVDGIFEPISVQTTPAQALRITSADEGALFYSSTADANTAIHDCCSFSNAYNAVPTSSEITSTNDGTYALHLPIGELNDGASAELVWFYAAGTLDELDAAVAEVAAQAVGRPTITPGNGTMTISWKPPITDDPITGYRVRWSTDGEAWNEAEVGPTINAHLVGDATNGESYIAQVAPLTGEGPDQVFGDWSPASKPVTPGLAVNHMWPVVSGAVKVGETLAVSDPDTNWTNNGNDPWTTGYQWQADDVDIAEATGESLVLTPDLVGAEISVVASRTNEVGTTSVDSPRTGEVRSTRIAALSVGGVERTPGASGTYAATLPAAVGEIEVAVAKESSSALVRVDGTFHTGSVQTIPLAMGSNVITIDVSDGPFAESYSLEVIRADAMVPPPPSPPSEPERPRPVTPLPPAPQGAAADTPTGFVYRLYLGLFGRLPDPVGLEYWSSKGNGGLPAGEIVNAFLGSPEARRTLGNLEPADFVQQLYLRVFGREPDAGGWQHWSQQIENGRLSRAAVVRALVDSHEMRHRILAALEA